MTSGDVERNPGPGNTSTDQNYCLTIYHHNIRSIRNKINDIVHIVQDFDIVFFTERHLDVILIQKIFCCQGLKILLGRIEIPREVVLLYIFKNNIRFSRRDDQESANVESMWFELLTKQSSILVIIAILFIFPLIYFISRKRIQMIPIIANR